MAGSSSPFVLVVDDEEHITEMLAMGLGIHGFDVERTDTGRGGKRIDLTPTEYKLLHYLVANARRVLTRDQILEHVWDYTFAGNASVLETYVSYLRRKVDAADPPLIHTVRGVGYSLRLPPGQ